MLVRSDDGGIYKSPRRAPLETSFWDSKAPLGVGLSQPTFIEGSTRAWRAEPGACISEQRPLRRVDAPPTNGSENLGDLWQGRGQPLDLKRQLSLPSLFFEDQGCVGPRMAQTPLIRFPPITLIPQVIRRVREHKHRVLWVSPLWRNHHWISELTQLLIAAPWPVPLRRDLLPQAKKIIWHPQPKLWALHVWAFDRTW